MLTCLRRREPLDRTQQRGIPLKTPASPTDRRNEARQSDLRQACQAFEGMLLGEMLKVMRNDSPMGEGILPTGTGERIFAAQQSEALGSTLARSEPLGIARMLLESLTRPAGSSER